MKHHENSLGIRLNTKFQKPLLQRYTLLILFLLSGFFCYAANETSEITQKKVVTGIVSEKETKETLPGVSITIKGNNSKGTLSDNNGKYSLEVDSENDILVFSFMGKQIVEVPVIRKNTVNVEMEDDAKMLNEVVYVGYMTQKKADLTGSLALATSDDIEQNPSANAMKGLQGKLPGVFITTNGNPADEVGIQIRGLTSLRYASNPLIIIDGQPADINLRDINTMDIASIQVLKDAASASIYGSRAASGVILIETKKGKKGAVRVDYDAYVGYSRLIRKPDMLNTEQYGRAIWQATVNDGDDPATSIRIFNYDWYKDTNGIPVLRSVTPVEWLNAEKTMPSSDTDWFNAITRTGIETNHQLTVSGGTDRSSSLFSLNYFNNEGTQIHTHFTRYSIRMNNEYNLINNRLKIGEAFTMSYLNYNSRNEVYNALIMPSIVPVRTNNGGWGGTAMKLGMDDYNNPVRILTMEKDNNTNFIKTLGNAYLDFAILKNLHAKTQFGIDYSNNYLRHIDYTWQEGGGRLDDINGVNNDQNHTFNYTWTNTLLYTLSTQKHSLDALLGMEAFKYANEGFRAYRDKIYLENRDYAILNAAAGNTKNINGWADEYSMLSYFAKANYVYDAKYLFSATVRYDGVSKFGSNNRWGVFPAFSVGWRIKNERFMEGLKALSDLKLRASWGMNGNSNIPTNALANIYDTNYDATSYPITGNETGSLYSGYRRLRLGNENLKWEATKQTNLGFDFGFLNQRINGSFDYFYKKTENMLVEPPYIGALGEGGYRIVNGADMTNRGVEFIVSYSSEDKGSFQYNITANASSFKNKLTRLPANVISEYPGNGMLDNILGRPRNSFYGLVADGIFKTQEEVDNSPEQPGKGLGRIRYKDLDGDGRVDEAFDRTWIGISDPDFMAGLNIDLRYKYIDMSIFFQGVFGGEVYNTWKEYSDFWNITEQNDKNHPTRVLNAWSPSNPTSDIPALSRRNENQERRMSTYFIESGSYLKLRTLEIGYTFPESITKKLSAQRLRTYVMSRNIFTIKKWWGDNKFTAADPENPGFGYQIPFSMMFGINVSF